VGSSRCRGLPRRPRVNVEPNRRVESGSRNPVATTSTGTANASPSTAVVKRQRLLRSCLPFTANGRSPPDRWIDLSMEPKVPSPCNAKPDTTAGNSKKPAYPAQMPMLRTTNEFPEFVCIGRYKAICGYGHEPAVQEPMSPAWPRRSPKPPLGRRPGRAVRRTQRGLRQTSRWPSAPRPGPAGGRVEPTIQHYPTN
jgi:hypothetical protein